MKCNYWISMGKAPKFQCGFIWYLRQSVHSDTRKLMMHDTRKLIMTYQHLHEAFSICCFWGHLFVSHQGGESLLRRAVKYNYCDALL